MSKLMSCVAALGVGWVVAGCGDRVRPAPSTFTGRHIAAPPVPHERCPASASFSKREQACLPRRAGPPTGARSTGSLHLVRAPLVELFPPQDTISDPTFWVYVRLNRNPREYVDVWIN